MAVATRPDLLRRGLRLEYLTVGWNIAEGLIAIGAGHMTQRALAQQENESLSRAAMRTSGQLLKLAGIAGLKLAG